MELPDFDLKELVWATTSVGAINWGLQEAAQINLIADYVPELAGPAYLVIGAAGAVSLANQFGLVDVFGDSS